MRPWLLPLLLLLLAGPPAVRPAPPTCYSRMLGLSREISWDFQRLQATEPPVSPPRLVRARGVHADPGPPSLPWNEKSAVFVFWPLCILRVFVFSSRPFQYDTNHGVCFKHKEM